MVFSKLMGKSPGGKETEEEDDDDEEELEDVTAASSAVPGKTWENLLNWTPEYALLAGVFRDIAELPHNLQMAAAAGEAASGDGSTTTSAVVQGRKTVVSECYDEIVFQG